MSSIALAESITGGLISATLVECSGISEWLKGTIVAYSLESKTSLLGIDETLVNETLGVSQDISIQMAQNVRKIFNSDIGISTTGFAEKYKSFDQIAYIAVDIRDELYVQKIEPPSEINLTRNSFRKYIVYSLVNFLMTLDIDKSLSEKLQTITINIDD